MRSRLPLLVALVALVPGVAGARDSEAPPGAGHRWLPCEQWVMYHWLPYEEGSLYRLLGTSRAGVQRWLRDDRHHTLAQLARRRGLSPQRLADQLVEPWRGSVSPGRLGTLRRRALLTLTQGHLAQHLFFHALHQPAIGVRALRIFGVRSLEYRRLRLNGSSPTEIGRAHGRAPWQVRRSAYRVLRQYARRGVAAQAVPPRQAYRYLRLQRRALRHWSRSRIRKRANTTSPFYDRYRHRRLERRRLLCFLFAGREPRRDEL